MIRRLCMMLYHHIDPNGIDWVWAHTHVCWLTDLTGWVANMFYKWGTK